MTKNDLITIGITCYNAQDTILRALESALNQTWPNKEMLIVDDCSTDQSVQKIESYIQQNPKNINFIRQQINGGPAAARQTILKQAKGQFIAFFDDDDESLPERLEIQRQRIIGYEEKTENHLIACYASGKRLYPNGYEMIMPAIGSKSEIPHGSDVADRLLFYGGNRHFFYGSGTPTCSLMARKSVFEAVGGFDPDFRRVEDIDFAVRLALAGGHFIGCPEQLFIQYSSQAPDKAPEKNRDAELQLAEKHKNYLQTVGRYVYAKKWPWLRYYHFKRQYIKMLATFFTLLVRHPIKTLSHFFKTAPKRFFHEQKMNKGSKQCAL